jgi:hypothetical protein
VGNGYVDPGEDITVPVTLVNVGMQGATGVSATLSTTTPGVTVTTGTATFPAIAANGGTGASDPPHFVYRVDPGVACGTVIDFTLHAVCDQDPVGTDSAFTMTVGHVVSGSTTPIDEGFGTGDPPSGWTRVNGGTGTQQWTTTNPGGRTIPSGMTAPVEIIDSDEDGSGVTQDDSLVSPAFSAVGATQVTLTYDTYYYGYSNGYADVDVSADNGSTWSNVTHWTTTSVGSSSTASHQVLDVTGIAAGASQVKVRFHYTGQYAWYWMVDNVQVEVQAPGGCTVQACTPGGTPPGETAGTEGTRAKWVAGVKDCMEWGDNPEADHYHLYRGVPGSLPNLLNGGSDACFRLDDLADPHCTGLSEEPASGSFFWYLVTGWNVHGEGTAGNATDGPRQLNHTGPCS